MNTPFSELYTYFGYIVHTGKSGIVSCLVYGVAGKQYKFVISLDTHVKTNILIELTNADPTNAATSLNGLIYDIKI